MSPNTEKLLEQVELWPKEDQDELAEFAREIAARRSGVYVVDDEEETAIREGVAELDRGEWVSEEAMRSFGSAAASYEGQLQPPRDQRPCRHS